MLTGKKVKRSKQAVQDAFSVVHHNMVVIDQNMRDLLHIMQDLMRVLYVCFDSRTNYLQQNQVCMNERISDLL